MIRTAVLLFVALFGVSAVYGVQPPQLQLTSTFNQRMHLFSLLESCGRHVIATESVYTNFIALKHEETRNFHFYSIAEKQISFALTTVPETTDSFHAGDYFLFDISGSEIIIADSDNKVVTKTDTNILLENAPNEVKVHLNNAGFVVVSVNGFKHEVEIGAAHHKLFRYVSFLARPINFESQEFFLRCATYSQ